jgi:hypothetical protein
MKAFPIRATLALAAIVAAFQDAPAWAQARRPYDTPEVSAALADENVAAVAERTSDGETLVGLMWLASKGETREAIGAKIASVAPALAAQAASIMCEETDNLTEESVAAFLKADPKNAAAHCLNSYLLYKAGKNAEALAAFRQASALESFGTYEAPVRRSSLLALDALGLKGDTRLRAELRLMVLGLFRPERGSYAKTWLTLAKYIRDTTRTMPATQRNELAEQVLAFADRAGLRTLAREMQQLTPRGAIMGISYEMKSQSAPDKDMARAYMSTATSVSARGQEGEDWTLIFLSALGTSLAEEMNRDVDATEYSLTPEDKARVDEAMVKLRASAKSFVDAVVANDDAIVRDVLTGDKYAVGYNVGLSYPDIYDGAKAVVKQHEEVRALLKESSKPVQNKERMKLVALGALMYALDYKNVLPADAAVLVRQGYIRDPKVLKSPLSGRPYVYAAAGLDLNGRDAASVVLFYDEFVLPGDMRHVILGNGAVRAVSSAELAEMLRKQGK